MIIQMPSTVLLEGYAHSLHWQSFILSHPALLKLLSAKDTSDWQSNGLTKRTNFNLKPVGHRTTVYHSMVGVVPDGA